MEFLTPPPPIRRLRARRTRRGPARSPAAAPVDATATAPRRPAASPAPATARSARPSSRSAAWRSTTSRSPTPTSDAVKGGLAAGPPGRGAVADRPLGLRQDDPAALAQPAHRADPHGDADAAASLLDGDRHHGDRADLAAAPGDDGLPAAEPVPDERLRQHRLRPARAGLAAAAQEGARAARSTAPSTAPASSRRSRTTSTTRR